MSAPPGFNPDHSLLEGGTADIVPVMGGGGGHAPPGYNETSLLAGGDEAHIATVVGGGVWEGGAGSPNPPTMAIMPTNVIKLELYRVYDTQYDDNQGNFVRDLRTFINDQTKNWTDTIQFLYKRYYDEMKWVMDTNLPVTGWDKEIFRTGRHTIDRFLKKIPRDTNIIVLPPMYGSPSLFLDHLENLWALGIFTKEKSKPVVNPKYIVICQHPFFKIDSNCKIMSYLFLKCAAYNINNFFLVTEHSENAIEIGNILNIVNGIDPKLPLLNFLGPTYIYNDSESNKFKQGIMFMGDSVFPYTITKFKEGVLDPKTYITNANKLDYLLQFVTDGTELTDRPGKQNCELITNSVSADFLPSPTVSLKKSSRMIVVRTNVNINEVPLFCIDALDIVNINKERLFRTIFEGHEVVLRNWVYGHHDWKLGKFIASERDFLNSLHLTPNNIKSMGVTNEEIAEFLKNVIEQSCFSDVSLLTKTECGVARRFLNKIYKNYLSSILENKGFYGDETDEKPVDDRSFLDNWNKKSNPKITINDKEMYFLVLMLNKDSKNYSFKRVDISEEDIDSNELTPEEKADRNTAAAAAAKKKIAALENKYPNYILIR
jgi:hypothetical protein